MIKPESITQLSKEQLENMCLNLMHVDNEKANIIESLERQNEYLRSGEYLNQLKFERNLLEDIVQNGGISKEDKEFIDMTHRNTELLEENERLLKIAKKMHLYIFLNTTDEQKAYEEIGLTDEENAMLGYSGEFVLEEVE